MVAPFMGAWIETSIRLRSICLEPSRPSWARGLKLSMVSLPSAHIVAPFMGAWIETISTPSALQLAVGRALHGRVD